MYSVTRVTGRITDVSFEVLAPLSGAKPAHVATVDTSALEYRGPKALGLNGSAGYRS